MATDAERAAKLRDALEVIEELGDQALAEDPPDDEDADFMDALAEDLESIVEELENPEPEGGDDD